MPPVQVGSSPGQSDAVSDWFSEALGVRCWLVQQQSGSRHAVERKQLVQRSRAAAAAAEDVKPLGESERGRSIGAPSIPAHAPAWAVLV